MIPIRGKAEIEKMRAACRLAVEAMKSPATKSGPE